MDLFSLASNNKSEENNEQFNYKLRNISNGILGMSELLLTTDLNEEQYRYAVILKESSLLLMDIVKNIDKSVSEVSAADDTALNKNVDEIKNVKVLLAEDNVFNHMLTTELLAKKGCVITSALNGKEAVEFFQNNKFDIIFMDLKMPKMNGYEAALAIREIEKRRSINMHVPIIALSAQGSFEEYSEQLRLCSIDDWMRKPIDIEEAYEKIKKYLYKIDKYSQSQNIKNKALIQEKKDNSINLSVFNKITDGDDELKHKLIEVFIKSYPISLNEIKKAIDNKDSNTLEKSAHSLKGAVGNFSTEGAYQAAYTLQKMGEESNFEGINDIYNKLSKELSDLEKLLIKQY